MLRTERLHNLNRMAIMIMRFLRFFGGFNKVKALLQGGCAPARRGGYTQREITAAANCATGTVSNVQKRMRSSIIDDITFSMSASAARLTTFCAVGEMPGLRCSRPPSAPARWFSGAPPSGKRPGLTSR